MNSGALNAYALNGSVLDPVVRTRVDGFAYAVASTKPRVLAYERVAVLARAALDSVAAKVFTRTPVSVYAEATVSGVLGRVWAKLVASVTGSASINTSLYQIRCIVSPVVSAVVSTLPKVFARNRVQSSALASVSVVGGTAYRAILSRVARAVVSATGKVYQRRYLRSSVGAVSVANVVALSKTFARLVVFHSAPVLITHVARAIVRAPTHAESKADVVVDFSVAKQIPWDEPAPDERTFKVNPETFVFMVVS